MTVGLRVFEFHFPGERSLKQKRMILRRMKDRLRARFNVSVAEVDHQDLWQRAALAVVCVGSAPGPVESTLDAVQGEVERDLPGELLDVHTEFHG